MKTEPPTSLPVTADDVDRAAAVVAGHVVRTPTTRSQTLSELTGADVWVKFENLQFTASFKGRGARNRLAALSAEEAARGVVAMSAGNHAQGVARHARLLDVPATIVMPAATPFSKVEATRLLGADVVLRGSTLAEAADVAHELRDRHRLTLIHPYDDPDVIAGQGTVAVELLADAPEVDTLVVPVGGGGLIAGMAVAARARRPDLRVVGVEVENYAWAAAARGRPVPPQGGPTIAEGIAVARPGRLTAPIIDALVDDLVLVDEAHVERAMALYIEIEKTVAEGAAAAGLAALLRHRDRFAGRRVGLVLCGGNVDSRLLASVLMRNLVRERRLTRLSVLIDDRPGQLAAVAELLGSHGANVLEVGHQRLSLDLSAKRTSLEVLIETRDHTHADAVVDALRGAGLTVELPPVV